MDVSDTLRARLMQEEDEHGSTQRHRALLNCPTPTEVARLYAGRTARASKPISEHVQRLLKRAPLPRMNWALPRLS